MSRGYRQRSGMSTLPKCPPSNGITSRKIPSSPPHGITQSRSFVLSLSLFMPCSALTSSGTPTAKPQSSPSQPIKPKSTPPPGPPTPPPSSPPPPPTA